MIAHNVEKGATLKWMLVYSFLFFVFLSIDCQAKELHGRLGVGYNAEFSSVQAENGVPGLSLKYGITRGLSAELIVGLSTASPVNSLASIKLSQHLIMESQVNFYFFLAGGLVVAEGASSSEFLGGLGVEFFIPGIDSIGFSTDLGASLNNHKGAFTIKTMEMAILNAGIHYYF